MEAVGLIPDTPTHVRLKQEAQKSRRRYYPSTVLYTGYCIGLLILGLRSRHPYVAVAFFVAGMVLWTPVEYLIHRHVLHGRFADGPGLVQHFLHKRFDPLHWEHHARPWDGNHISGTLKDTLIFSGSFVALSFLFPFPEGPLLVAGFLQASVVEEWIHHSVHFYRFNNRYFRYIRRHHLYHHSPKGMQVGFGLTNGFWDIVWDTRIPETDRRALYGKRPTARSQSSDRHSPEPG
jgi:sterol desaturase/sphingolipid hydroxylase (fatty acid hydroxylase superfamily)